MHCIELGIDQGLGTILDDLSVLTVHLNHWLNDSQAPYEPLDLQTRGNIIQVRLLRRYSGREVATALRPLENTLCLAALVFTVLVFQTRHELEIQTIHHTAIALLMQNLMVTPKKEWERDPDLLLWVFVIGAIGARGSPELPWFLSRLSSFCSSHGLTNENEVIKRIRPLLWIDHQLRIVLTQIWHASPT